MERQEQISSTIMQCHLHLILSHVSRMGDEHQPKQLLVCSLMKGSHALVGGKKLQCNDIDARDLKLCGFSNGWLTLAQNCNVWCRDVKQKMMVVNVQAEKDQKQCKDARRRK